MTQYDKIAEQYDQSADKRNDREMILVPSARHYLGDLEGLEVLDLACGSGYFTRKIKEWGAKNVLGVDISSEMIELAKRREKQSSLGLQFQVADLSNQYKFGEFDIVFAGFLLHYSSSVEQLQNMCNTISLNLKKAGKFIAFNENPFKPLHDGIKYGVEAKAFGDICDGAKIERTHFVEGTKDFSFSHYHYEPNTYEKALKASGFLDIKWEKFVCSKETISWDELEYWQDYLTDFSISVLLCQKN